MEIELALEFVRVVEEAAIESARTMGRGDREGADRAAVEAMRRVLDTVPVAGTVVIGEGERDEAPMLYIGEKVGLKKEYSDTVPEIDIAVDRWKGQTCVHWGRRAPSQCSRPPSTAGCCMPPTATWKRLSSDPHRRAWWTSKPRFAIT